MNVAEYGQKETKAFDDANIPQELRSAMSYHAYEQGHTYGYHEVLNCIGDLIENFQLPLKNFEARIRKECS